MTLLVIKQNTISNIFHDSLTEAEYAYQLKKRIIPLKMESGYQPDGWLGFILGSRLFFDFGGKYPFETKVDGLIKEIQSKLERVASSKVLQGNGVRTITYLVYSLVIKLKNMKCYFVKYIMLSFLTVETC